MTKIDVRMMKRDDREHIMQILEATPEFTSKEKITAFELIDAYLTMEDESGYHCAVAEYGNAITGYVCYGPTPLTESTWDIYWLAVEPGSQGNGIGRALIEYAEEQIFDASGSMVLVETSSKTSYERTRRFYRNMQYSELFSIPDYYAPGDDKVIYQKKILQRRRCDV